MTITTRDKRFLVVGAIAVGIILGYYFFTGDSTSTGVVEVTGTVPAAEQRLAQVRRLATQTPAAEQELKRLSEELTRQEKGLIRSETAQQAQAQLLQILRRLGNNQVAPTGVSSCRNWPSPAAGQKRTLWRGAGYGIV